MAELEAGKEYWSSGDVFIYIEDVPHNPEFAICREGGDDYGYMTVCRKSDLKPREETWQWQQKEKYKQELEKVTEKVQENLDELAERVVDKALKSLSSRMKMNALFGDNSSNLAWIGVVTQELEKLIRESGKKIAKKESIDL